MKNQGRLGTSAASCTFAPSTAVSIQGTAQISVSCRAISLESLQTTDNKSLAYSNHDLLASLEFRFTRSGLSGRFLCQSSSATVISQTIRPHKFRNRLLQGAAIQQSVHCSSRFHRIGHGPLRAGPKPPFGAKKQGPQLGPMRYIEVYPSD